MVQSRLGSITFVDNRTTAELYARVPNDRRKDACSVEPRVITARLRIDRPLIVQPEDAFVSLEVIIDAIGVMEATRIALKFAEAIEGTCNWQDDLRTRWESVADLLERNPSEFGKLYFDAYKYLDDADEVALLKRVGYDGAVHAGNGASAGDVEYRVFSVEQVTIRGKA
jgi:hypothetical protein